MLQIEVVVNPDQVPGLNGIQFQFDLGKSLVHLAAQFLSCQDAGGSLTEKDVSVYFRESRSFDVVTHDFSIGVIANDFPDRHANLQERTDLIRDGLRDILKHKTVVWQASREVTFSIWVTLSPGGFSEGSEGRLEPQLQP